MMSPHARGALSVRGLAVLSLVVAAVCVVATGGAAVSRPVTPIDQQAPAATFRTRVNVIEVDAVVLDQHGRFVADLVADEFQILEDGKPQRLASVRAVNIPIERVEAPLAASRPIQPDVRSNATPFDGRVYLIVLDDLHTDARRSNLARQLAREFIEKHVTPDDLASVVTTSANPRTAQGFTNDRASLVRAVDTFVGRKVMSPGLAASSYAGTPEAQSPEAAAPERLFNARRSMEMLRDVATFAGGIRSRRKAVVLIGEGIDYDFGRIGTAPPSTMTESEAPEVGFVHESQSLRELRERLKEFVDAANRANVSLYAFDPRVYTHGGDDFVDIAAGPPENMMGTEHESEKIKTGKLQDDLLASRENLAAMAGETGGFAVTGSPKAVAAGFERVRVENSSYYIIGYYPANEARDGKFRRIDVRVTRPGVTVQARRGYTAPRGNVAAPARLETAGGTSPALREALGATLPVSGFTLHATAAPFRGNGASQSVAVTVQIGGRDVQFVEKGDRFEGSVELAAVAVDPDGKGHGGERLTVDMPLTAPLRDYVAKAGIVFQMRMELLPGKYQLRVAGRDAVGDRVGSVYYDLEVPDFSDAPVTMSGLVLTAEGAGQVPAPRPDEPLQKLLSASPLAVRNFAAADTLVVLAEVYDNQVAEPPHTIAIATTVEAEDGRVVFQREEQRTSEEIRAARGTCQYVVRVPLVGLGPGSYALRVEARSSLRPDVLPARALVFRVR